MVNKAEHKVYCIKVFKLNADEVEMAKVQIKVGYMIKSI